MKTKMKALTLVLCAMLLVVASVMGTLAYLKATTDVVKNTFTVGNVKIDLDEAKVTEYGIEVQGAGRVKENTYKLLPGHTYVKDPTVTVEEKSEQCFVRMQVTVKNVDVLKKAFPQFVDETTGVFMLQYLVEGWDNSVWEYKSYNNGVYEFWYTKIVDARNAEQVLEPLFTHVVIPGTIDNDTLATLDAHFIDIVAHAMQADGFNTPADAWAQWTN